MNIWGLKQKLKGYQIKLKNLIGIKNSRYRETKEINILQRKISLYKNLILKERELRRRTRGK